MKYLLKSFGITLNDMAFEILFIKGKDRNSKVFRAMIP